MAETHAELGYLPTRMCNDIPCSGEWECALDYKVHINDGRNFHVLYKDIFRHRIYYFDCDRRDPLVLDCGSNIGMSILYFKHVYPAARIVAFEPDPTILPYLRDNLARNGITDVKLIESALWRADQPKTLHSDGKYGSSIAGHAATDSSAHSATHTVSCVRLRDYLTEPVDFLKMNIEGSEWDVLSDSEDRLHQVRAMVVEYHHLPGLPRTLHKILELLDRQGFEYLINDFDAETNPQSQPPFRLGATSRYFLLVYAQRKDRPT